MYYILLLLVVVLLVRAPMYYVYTSSVHVNTIPLVGGSERCKGVVLGAYRWQKWIPHRFLGLKPSWFGIWWSLLNRFPCRWPTSASIFCKNVISSSKRLQTTACQTTSGMAKISKHWMAFRPWTKVSACRMPHIYTCICKANQSQSSVTDPVSKT